MTRIALISDMHLSRPRPFFHFNWEITLERLAEAPPDLILVGGDMALDGAHNPEDVLFARRQLDRLPAPWLAVPGNHDVGNNHPDVRGEAVVTPERLAHYEAAFGTSFWCHDVGDWRIVGLNSLLCGSGLPQEEAQRRFLDETIAGRGTRRVATLCHKPFCNTGWDEAPIGQHFWFPEARDLLIPHLRAGRIDLQISGHLHEGRCTFIEGIPNLWIPSLAFCTDMTFDWRANILGGRRRVGMVEMVLDGPRWSARTVEPDELLHTDISGWMRRGSIATYARFAGQDAFRGFVAPEE